MKTMFSLIGMAIGLFLGSLIAFSIADSSIREARLDAQSCLTNAEIRIFEEQSVLAYEIGCIDASSNKDVCVLKGKLFSSTTFPDLNKDNFQDNSDEVYSRCYGNR
jgi:hypothetical protein